MRTVSRLAYISVDRGIPIFGRKAGSVHAQEILRAWAGKGASIDVFAAAIGNNIDDEFKNTSIRLIPSLDMASCGRSEPKQLLRRIIAVNRAIASTLANAQQNGCFDLVYERYSLWSYAAMELAQKNRTVSVLEVNAPLIREQNVYRTPISTEVASTVARRAFRAATIILAVSDQVASELEAFPEARKKVLIVPNGVNLERFRPKANANSFVQRGEYRIGFVGGFKRWHGVEMLIASFLRLRGHIENATLTLIGEGPTSSRIQEMVRSIGISAAVEFVGSVAPSEIPSHLQNFDVAVAPYESLPHFYFSPLKLFEYMGAGLPVVASRIGQIAQIIENRRTGLLVTPGDAIEMGDAFILLARNPHLRLWIGDNARKQAERLHSWNLVVDKVLEQVPKRFDVIS